MRISSLLLLFTSTTLATTKCLNEDYNHDPMQISPSEARRSLSTLQNRGTANIDLYVHLLLSELPKESYEAAVSDQVRYLNAQYEKWGYHFTHKLTKYAINSTWAHDIDDAKTEKMAALHRGYYQSLNVYMVEGAGGGVCSLPNASSIPIDQETLDGDGCFIPLPALNSTAGGTLTHEVGHWFGLYHVFQGECSGDGDYCDDTAPQAAASNTHMAVPGDLDSCPAKQSCKVGTFDNVKNFMDYTDCSSEFTACQGGRMGVTWTRYREGRALADGVIVKP